MKSNNRKQYLFHTREGRRNIILSLIAILLGVVFLFPIYWMLQISFKSDMETFGKVLTFFPHQFTIDPWIANLGDKNFLESLRNSFINGFLTMILTVIFGIPAAYGMGRYKLKGYQGFLLIFLVAQMLPASLMLTPMYLTFNKMHLLGTFFAPPIAIAAGSVPFAVVTLRPYFKSVPVTLDEAARIDGCNSIKSFFLVMIPAVKTGIITIITISRFSFCFLLLSMTAAVPKVSTIDTVVARSDSMNCFIDPIPLPFFSVFGVCNLMFIGITYLLHAKL